MILIKKYRPDLTRASYVERSNCMPENIPSFEERGKEIQLSLVDESKQISVRSLEQSIVLIFDKREIIRRAVINCFSTKASTYTIHTSIVSLYFQDVQILNEHAIVRFDI